MQAGRGFELTYCTNIHPAEGWPAVLDNLRRCAPELKSRLSPAAPFGIGLRLSNAESVELLDGSRLQELRDFLEGAGLYVALMNGYGYGWFHGRPLKSAVFAPDWQSRERVDYTLRLVEILRRVLPKGLEGGVSTCPLSYKPWFQNNAAPDEDLFIRNIVDVVMALLDARRRDGSLIHLDIEPEPDGWIENTAEFVRFFRDLMQKGAPLLASSARLRTPEAAEVLLDHVRLCLDLCHFAVEGEEVLSVLKAIRQEGVRLGRVQLSSAMRVTIPAGATEREQLRKRLAPFADPVYLHQVIGDRERFPDLPEGLAGLTEAHGREWRIHYHVPLFLKDYGTLGSTQSEVQAALGALASEQVRHLEIETYTWDVLPRELKANITDSIEREYQWVLEQL